MPGVKATMDEFKSGTLHSGSKTGSVVKSQKQALAIALNEERKAGKDKSSKQRTGKSRHYTAGIR